MAGEYSLLEFFAGGGMARLGLGDSWRCLLANDFDPQKCAAYRANFGGDHLIEADIASLTIDDLPTMQADLMWGSFPCQDLSLAGGRGGIKAKRSGAFFSFWRLIEKLNASARAPQLIVLENVTGLLTSNGGRDFAAVADSIASLGYRVSAMVLDAADFTPQSRPRLFIFGFGPDVDAPATYEPGASQSRTLKVAWDQLSTHAKDQWIWPAPAPRTQRNIRLADIIEWECENWHTAEQTQSLLAMMSKSQRERIDGIIRNKARRAGAAFRRTRIENGKTVQRLEARFDGLAGCLRTPAGGSSRQIVIAVENGAIKTRLLNPREAARLMGLPDDYVLPVSTTAALKLCGDGVCVPVVQWLAENILAPALSNERKTKAA